MRYGDEKYVERLEEELKDLKRRLSRTTEAAQSRALRAGGDVRGSSAVVAEEMYRRARTEVAAEAGAGYGRVSLEALYLLPAEFTNAYQRLFLAALKESPGQTSEPNPLVKRPPQLIRKEEGQVLDRDPDRGGGSARGGGKRHREHWIIKDESAFRLKERIDGELRDLAAAALSGLTSRAAGKVGRPNQSTADGATTGNEGTAATVTASCSSCGKFLKTIWRYCPHCGAESKRERGR